MEPISNTLRNRLAAPLKPGEHPDANLLSAYAENGLATRERESVMAHLARCVACRDLVLLAAPETLPALAKVPRRSWVMRPVVRWAAASAAILVVGAAVTLRQQSHSVPATTTVGAAKEQKVAPAPEPQLHVNAPMASEATRAEKNIAVAKKSAPFDKFTTHVNGAIAAKPSAEPKQALSTPTNAPMVARTDVSGSVDRAHAFGHGNSANLSPAAPAADKLDQFAKLQTPPPPPPLHNAPIQTQSNAVTLAQVPAGSYQDRAKTAAKPPATASSSETVEVAGAAPSPTKGEVPASSEKRPSINADSATASAMQAGPMAGAAGVVGGMMVAKSATQNVVCSIIADGVRCLRDRRVTELHQANANLKSIASQGDVIWAGGDALVRSDDGGATWKDVKKPSEESVSQLAIMADGVLVRSASGATWKTSDNGATWSPVSPSK